MRNFHYIRKNQYSETFEFNEYSEFDWIRFSQKSSAKRIKFS